MDAVLPNVIALIPQPELQLVTTLPHLGAIFCQDRTFDRLGDVRIPRSVPKGWQPVTNDPTALAVANRFCPWHAVRR